ncbi:hypothetical protein Mapa_006437 [Marchantia paleacea]|nr:hypothetical protein Mapa_006437 [Marchantia paleacea]
MAPECAPAFKGKVTDKSDLYSFGAVTLETECGRKPLDTQSPSNQILLFCLEFIHRAKSDPSC